MGRSRRLLAYGRPYRAAFALSFFAAVIASVLDGFMLALLIPFLRLLFGASSGFAESPTPVERVLDWSVGGVFASGDPGGALRAVVLVILAAVVIKNLAVYTTGYASQYLQGAVARDLRTGLYGHVQKLGLGYLQRTRGGQLLSRVVADVEEAKWLVSAALVSVMQNAALVAVYLAVLFSLSWPMALVMLAVTPLIVLVLRPILRRVRSLIGQALEDRGELAAIVDRAGRTRPNNSTKVIRIHVRSRD